MPELDAEPHKRQQQLETFIKNVFGKGTKVSFKLWEAKGDTSLKINMVVTKTKKK